MSRKNIHSDIDIKTADQMLQNVFQACDMSPNTVPLETIVKKCKFNGIFYDICLVLCILLFATTLLWPLHFIPGNEKLYKKPTLLVHEAYDDGLRITTSSRNIDLENSYMERLDGSRIYALSYNRLGRTIVFPFPDEEINIFIHDKSGAELHLLFTPAPEE